MAGRHPAPSSAAVPDSAAVPAGNPPPADVWGRRLSDGAGAVKQIQIEGIRQATPQPSGFARATRPKQEAALARNLEKSTCKFHFASKSGKAVSTLHRAKTSVKSAAPGIRRRQPESPKSWRHRPKSINPQARAPSPTHFRNANRRALQAIHPPKDTAPPRPSRTAAERCLGHR